ncbi:hemolysin family protein [Faecalibaculum rodentium]|jgi:putative hemolysin|uniref:hemolysin family protein n=1 Tax=Faecalibaculum rodentium TaxID=1702221 RepID=UPI00256F6107|nr:hemolysin family protein [Faecalibaculum rodentium]
MWILILVQVVLIALNAVFACAEIAVLSVNERKMEKLSEEGNKSAGRIATFLKHPETFLSTIQVAITLSGFLGSAFAADNFAGSLTDWLTGLGVGLPRDVLSSISVIVITLILSYFTLIFGELVPKRLAMRKSESLSLTMSGFLQGISVVFRPLVWLLSVSTNAVLRLMGIDPNEEQEQAGEEEILLMVDSGRIAPQEKQLIANVFDFNDLTLRELCTHRVDVDFLEQDDSLEEWEKIIHETRHSLYPVRGEDEEILGVLDTKDFFRMKAPDRQMVMASLKPALFVPETVKADNALTLMKQAHCKLAVVLDEYGGIEGVVTLQDLAEAIVGVMEADDDIPVVTGDFNRWQISGNVALSDLEDITGIRTGCDADTVTGLITEKTGHVLRPGDEVKLDDGRYTLRVEIVKDHVLEQGELIRVHTDNPAVSA